MYVRAQIVRCEACRGHCTSDVLPKCAKKRTAVVGEVTSIPWKLLKKTAESGFEVSVRRKEL